ncbi:RHS repeat-associated core domain-containing protein, partial [Burkholderia diffusa]|uniref:RHS repeat-associated core domain-containing protein n=1 Tax=Burkholderia diffusa TaxID=488732 RepID=UPI000A7E77F8
ETTHYVYEPGSFTPLLRVTGPAVLEDGENEAPEITSLAYYHCDQIGTPQELTDEAGEVAWSARYQAWGEAREVIGEAARKAGIANPLRFAGQYFDRETGLHYNRHRYYDPGSGRFVSKDPIGLAGGINVYQYAPNPIGWIDPLGLERIKNAIEGARREDVFNAQMRAKHPNATIQCQCYLRDAQGKSVRDPVTGERRRVDTAVIENGRAQTYEVTSLDADKDFQAGKEGRIIQNGGQYIRDRSNNDLVPVNGVSELIRIP